MRYFTIFLILLFPVPVVADDLVWGCTLPDATGASRCGQGHWVTRCEIFLVSGTCGPVFELIESAVSNVLFLPGIKGSRLYANGERLWQPFGSEDVKRLFLTEEGRSSDPRVYAQAGDLLSDVFGQQFYTSFLNDLEEAEVDDTYGPDWTWESGAYDWRLSLTDIVTRGARYDDHVYFSEVNGLPYLERLLRDLAQTSATGKVTIIAHSNGGLVAKELMHVLGEEGESLVDKMIFVGVPQSGAPRAIAGALFGYGEALPFDSCANASRLCSLLVDRETARSFAEDSPMTYHLLPSLPYFADTNDHGHPPVRWSGMHHYPNERLAYGAALDSTSELYDFLLARDGGRTKPEPNDTGSANVLSEGLIAYANTVHLRLDAWMPPPGVEVHQIAGWGRETFGGIEFYEEPRLLGLPAARYRPTFISGGDGIVPGQSAAMMRGDSIYTYWFDLYEHEYSHADLFESESVRALIENILTNTSALPLGITRTLPEHEKKSRLEFILHSPLTLGITDAHGAYTGLTEDGSILQERTDIEYGRMGEVQYLTAPSGEPYTLTLHGTGSGTFSLDLLERFGDDRATTTTMGNIPVTENTIATLFVPAITGNLSNLIVDVDGDGVTDIEVTPKLGETVVLATEEQPLPEASHTRRGAHHRKAVVAEAVETEKEEVHTSSTTTASTTGTVLGSSTLSITPEEVREEKKKERLLWPLLLLIPLLPILLVRGTRKRRAH